MTEEENQDDVAAKFQAMLQGVENVRAFGQLVAAFYKLMFEATDDAEAAVALTQTFVACWMANAQTT